MAASRFRTPRAEAPAFEGPPLQEPKHPVKTPVVYRRSRKGLPNAPRSVQAAERKIGKTATTRGRRRQGRLSLTLVRCRLRAALESRRLQKLPPQAV